MTSAYLYSGAVETENLELQQSEVESVRWFDIEEVWQEIQHNRERFCVPTEGLKILRDHLNV